MVLLVRSYVDLVRTRNRFWIVRIGDEWWSGVLVLRSNVFFCLWLFLLFRDNLPRRTFVTLCPRIGRWDVSDTSEASFVRSG